MAPRTLIRCCKCRAALGFGNATLAYCKDCAPKYIVEEAMQAEGITSEDVERYGEEKRRKAAEMVERAREATEADDYCEECGAREEDCSCCPMCLCADCECE
jgi:hypothetical protein